MKIKITVLAIFLTAMCFVGVGCIPLPLIIPPPPVIEIVMVPYYAGPYYTDGGYYYYYEGGFYNHSGGRYHLHHYVAPHQRGHYDRMWHQHYQHRQPAPTHPQRHPHR